MASCVGERFFWCIALENLGHLFNTGLQSFAIFWEHGTISFIIALIVTNSHACSPESFTFFPKWDAPFANFIEASALLEPSILMAKLDFTLNRMN